MAEKSTYVKLDRNLLNWRWLQNPKTLAVWVWLLLKANIVPHDFEKETIQRGEVATSRKTIGAAVGLTEDEVRTALNHLKSTGEITSRVRSKYQVITILEYDKYQDGIPGKSPGKSPADPRQVPGKSPQSKNIRKKEGKNEKNIYMSPPTVAQVEEFAAAEGLTLDAASFIQYNEARGWQGVKDWRPLVRLRASQMTKDQPQDNNDGLDEFGRPIRKEFE